MRTELAAVAATNAAGTASDTPTGSSRRRREPTGRTVAAERPLASIPATPPGAGTVTLMGTRRHTLLIGPEPLRRHLREPGPSPLLVDAADEDPSGAVRSAGLFTTSVRVVRGEELDAEATTRLAEAVAVSSLPVTIEAEKMHPANEKKLSAECTVRKLSLGSNGRNLVRDIAARLGVELAGEAADEILERLGHDPGRLVGALEALSAGGYARPGAAQIRLLSGSSRSEGLPWALLDELEKSSERAAETIKRLEAIPTIAFMAKRVRVAAFTVEHPETPREQAAETLGEISEGAWRQARRLGERIGRARCHRLLPVLAEADTHAKRGKADAALRLAVGAYRLALLESPATPQR